MGYFINNDTSPSVTRFSVEHLNNDLSVIPGVNLQLYFCATDGSKSQALQAAETLISQYNVRVIIGGRTSDETEISNIASSFHNVPQIGAVNLSPSLSDKKTYPYFLRVNPPAQYQNAALLSLIRHYGWSQIYVVYSNDLYGIGGFSNLQVQAASETVHFYSSQITGGTKNFTGLISSMKDIIAQTRVRIFLMYCQANDAILILKLATEAGLMGKDSPNAFILTNAIGVGFVMQQHNISNYPYLQGALTLTARAAVAGPLLDQLNTEWRSANSTLFPGPRFNPTQEWYYHDAVYTIARALDSLMKLKPLDNITGAELLATMLASNFTGVTGPVNYDANSDRKGDYVWYNLRETFQQSFSEIAAIYSPFTLNTTMSDTFPLTFNGRLKQPDGICPCVNGVCDDDDVCNCNEGWEGKSCNIFLKTGGNQFDTVDYIVVTVVPVIVLSIILIVAVQIVKRKRKALIKDMTQKQRSLIKRSDITLQNRIGRGASGEVFKGMFRGTEVAVKKVTTGANSVITQQFEMECAIMTALRHPNIVMFMGMCLVPEQGELLLVMELMEKGSLHDILHNVYSKIQFTQTLCLHIAHQAAKGMNFLHQSDPPIIHCDLKSHNILMDDKWNARISDFGITKFKRLNDKKEKSAKDTGVSSIGTIYWTAPEVFLGQKHAEASDCYSFGIVLWELFHREIPYGGKEPMLVATEVQGGARPELRDDLDPNIRALITDCWAQEPSARPTFETIMNRLRLLNSASPVAALEAQARANIEAPTGTVYLVATEVAHVNELWDAVPIEMCEAMKMHNKYIRQKLETMDGYEIECTLNGFLLAFRNVKAAIDFCLTVQIELLSLKWPQALLDHPAASVRRDGFSLIYSGLRVRMAVHAGVPNCHTDPLGRMQYVGPIVERTKKLLYSTSNCCIVTSNIVMDHGTTKGIGFVEEPSVAVLGEVLETARGAHSGRSKSDQVFDVLPKSLEARRKFRSLNESTQDGIPNAIVVDVDTKQQSKILFNTERNHGPSWVAILADLTEKEKVGRGAIGDYIRSFWKGREIVQKVLMNQQIAENDILVLKAHASVLVKLQHKNLLPFYGVCLEPDHISLLIQYMPKGQNLTALLKDSSVSLSFQTKVKIAKQIAEGMAYLVSQSQHKWLTTFANLKSGNVMVEKDTMNVKITDFGQGNLKDLARTMTSIGTVAWTAPELLNDEESTPKIAQYSFGIIMWEIYTRLFPYADDHPIKVVTKIVAGHRPHIPADCPAQYKELMTQCWDNDPNQRPTWGEVIAVLSSL